jgi:hypothetical protein
LPAAAFMPLVRERKDRDVGNRDMGYTQGYRLVLMNFIRDT